LLAWWWFCTWLEWKSGVSSRVWCRPHRSRWERWWNCERCWRWLWDWEWSWGREVGGVVIDLQGGKYRISKNPSNFLLLGWQCCGQLFSLFPLFILHFLVYLGGIAHSHNMDEHVLFFYIRTQFLGSQILILFCWNQSEKSVKFVCGRIDFWTVFFF